jgi:hypothetical protein
MLYDLLLDAPPFCLVGVFVLGVMQASESGLDTCYPGAFARVMLKKSRKRYKCLNKKPHCNI